MPTDPLTPTRPDQLAASVLTVLAGTDLDTVAATAGIPTCDLDNAVRTYHAAGLAALQCRTDNAWYDVRVEFADWADAETISAHQLAPRLDHLEATGALAGWWFLRKHPCWRLRLHSADTGAVGDALTALVDAGQLARWWPTRYEPETAAFGGPAATEHIHALFCADTRGLNHYLRRGDERLHRRDISLLLLAGLLHAAGLDTFETGDVFGRVAQLRPTPPAVDHVRIAQLTEHVQTVLTVPDPCATGLFTPGGPAEHDTAWLDAYRTAGHQLGDAAAHGHLDRGLRAVLTHIVLFHWNRLGLSANAQAVLARAAATALLPRS